MFFSKVIPIKDKMFSWYIVVVLILGIVVSMFLLLTETNVLFKKNTFTKTIIIESEHDIDSGYVMLLRNEKTPSMLEYVKFKNNQQYMFFTISGNNVIWEKLYFDVPILETGRYFIDYEIVFESGKKERKTISFFVFESANRRNKMNE
jgi:hypothetical protein